MSHKFSELREKMSPEAQGRSALRAKAELLRIAYGDLSLALHHALIDDAAQRDAVSDALHQMHVAVHEAANALAESR